MGEDGMRAENKLFYEMLILTYSSKKEQYEEIMLKYKQMLNNNEAEMWDDFDKKISMLIEEISCFLEIADDLNTIEGLCEKNKQHQTTTKQKLRELDNSTSTTVGFFNKKPKGDKIQEYKAEIKETEELDQAYQILLNVLPQVIINHEIDTIKIRKKFRHDDAVKTFSQRKLKSLEDCLQLWQCIKDDTVACSMFESNVQNK